MEAQGRTAVLQQGAQESGGWRALPNMGKESLSPKEAFGQGILEK